MDDDFYGEQSIVASCLVTLDRLLDDAAEAIKSLEGIRETIEDTGRVTENQTAAIGRLRRGIEAWL